MDPFRELIVAGGFGLLGWFAMAAAVGASLRWLDIRSRRLPPARPPQGSRARMREAA
jgi:hypothetical protein